MKGTLDILVELMFQTIFVGGIGTIATFFFRSKIKFPLWKYLLLTCITVFIGLAVGIAYIASQV